MKINNEMKEIGYRVKDNVERIAGALRKYDNTEKDKEPALGEVFVSSSEKAKEIVIPSPWTGKYDEILRGSVSFDPSTQNIKSADINASQFFKYYRGAESSGSYVKYIKEEGTMKDKSGKEIPVVIYKQNYDGYYEDETYRASSTFNKNTGELLKVSWKPGMTYGEAALSTITSSAAWKLSLIAGAICALPFSLTGVLFMGLLCPLGLSEAAALAVGGLSVSALTMGGLSLAKYNSSKKSCLARP